jgi:hypothetical protein
LGGSGRFVSASDPPEHYPVIAYLFASHTHAVGGPAITERTTVHGRRIEVVVQASGRRGRCGQGGPRGRNGNAGMSGAIGRAAPRGIDRSDGKVKFCILNTEGTRFWPVVTCRFWLFCTCRVLEEGSDRYHAIVLGYSAMRIARVFSSPVQSLTF